MGGCARPASASIKSASSSARFSTMVGDVVNTRCGPATNSGVVTYLIGGTPRGPPFVREERDVGWFLREAMETCVICRIPPTPPSEGGERDVGRLS